MFASDILPIQNRFLDCKAENISQIKKTQWNVSVAWIWQCKSLPLLKYVGIDGLSWSHDSVIEVSKKKIAFVFVYSTKLVFS